MFAISGAKPAHLLRRRAGALTPAKLRRRESPELGRAGPASVEAGRQSDLASLYECAEGELRRSQVGDGPTATPRTGHARPLVIASPSNLRGSARKLRWSSLCVGVVLLVLVLPIGSVSGQEPTFPSSPSELAHLESRIPRAPSEADPLAGLDRVAETFNPFNGSVVAGSQTIPDAGEVDGAVWDPASDQMFVGSDYGNLLWVVNGSTGHFVRTIRIGTDPYNYADPRPFAVNPGEHELFVGSLIGLTVLDTSTDTTVRTVSLPQDAHSVIYDATSQTVLVTGSDRMSSVNPSTGKVVANLSVCGDGIRTTGYDPTSSTVYVSCGWGPAHVEVLDALSLQPQGNVSLPNNDTAVGFAFDPVNRMMYAADGFTHVTVLNASTDSVAVPVAQIAVPNLTSNLAVDPSTGLVYAAPYDANIPVINPLNETLEPYQLPSDLHAVALAIDPQDHRLFLTDYTGPSIAVDSTTDSVSSVIDWIAAQVQGGTYDSANGLVYLTDANADSMGFDGLVTVIDPSPVPVVVANLAVPGLCPGSIAVDPRLDRIFVSNTCNDSVSVINGSSNSPMGSPIAVGIGPRGMAYDDLTGTIYVACEYGSASVPDNRTNDGSVWVINASSLRVVASGIPTGSSPLGVAVDSRTNTVWVANFDDENMTGINGTTNIEIPGAVPIHLSAWSLTYDPENHFLYAVGAFAGRVEIIDPANRTVYGSVSISGGRSAALAYDSTDQLLFAVSEGNVSVLNPVNQSLAGPAIPLNSGVQASGVVYVPGSHQLEVLDYSGAIDVVANAPRVLHWSGPSQTDIGAGVGFNATASGGTAPYSFAYQGFPAGCAVGNASSALCRFPSSGNWSLEVRVTDAAGYWGEAERNLTVVAGPVEVSLGASPSSLDLGQSTEILYSVHGGSGILHYGYTGLPPGCGSVNEDQFSCLPGAAGVYEIRAVASDPVGESASANLTLAVNPSLAATVLLSSNGTVVSGQTVIATVLTIGGTGPFRFQTTAVPPGCFPSDVPSFDCAPTTVGWSYLNGTVSDSLGEMANFSTVVIVLPLPGVLGLVEFEAHPSSLTVGGTLELVGVVANGTPPFVWTYSGLPPGCSSVSTPTLACHPTGAGSFRIGLNVADGAGNSAVGSVVVHVGPAPSVSARPQNSVGLEEVGVVIAVAAVATLIWFRARGKSGFADREGSWSARRAKSDSRDRGRRGDDGR